MCCIDRHRGHNTVVLTKIVKAKKELIKKKAEEIEDKHLPEYLAVETDTELRVSKMIQEFAKRSEEMKELRKIWHQEVDNIFDEADAILSSMQDLSMISLLKHQTQITAEKEELVQAAKEHHQIWKSNRASEINGFKLGKYRKTPKAAHVKVPTLNTEIAKGRELWMEIGTFKAKLSQSSVLGLSKVRNTSKAARLPVNAKVIAIILSDFVSLFRVACVGSDEAWISGSSKCITRTDTNGSVLNNIDICGDDWPRDIAVTRQGELLYSGATSRTIKIVSQGRVKTMITAPKGWTPKRLCCTRSGDILANLSDGKKNKIVRYYMYLWTATQVIDRDEHGDQIFENGVNSLVIAENNNEDICVSDVNAFTVVVLDKAGIVQFRYDNTSTPVGRKMDFSRKCIVTDSLSQIIAADYNNDCLHILDQYGKFLRYLDSCGLENPCGLSVDSMGRLLVGLLHKGEIKVIQYLM